MAWGSILGTTIGSVTGGNAAGLGTLGSMFDLYGTYSAQNSARQDAKDALALQQAIAKSQIGLANQAYADDSAVRNRVLDRSNALAKALGTAYQGMGSAYTVTPQAVEAEAANRYGLYEQAVNDAFSKAGSQGIADRINSGMDQSTYDIMSRAELGDRAATALTQARQQAYTDALSYMTGLQSADAAGRNQTFNELNAVYGTPATLDASVYGGGAQGINYSKLGMTNSASLSQLLNSNANKLDTSLGTQLEDFKDKYLPSLLNMLK